MNGTVKFTSGTRNEYLDLVSAHLVDIDTLYFLIDTHELYKGIDLIASTDIVFSQSIPEFDSSVIGKLYVVTTGVDIGIYAKGATQMEGLPSSGAIGVGSIRTLAAFSTELITTTAEIETAEGDGSLPTVGAVKSLVESNQGPTWGELLTE